MKKALLLGLASLVIVVLTACNLPGNPTTSAPPQMQTAAALTVAAALNQTPQASPLPQTSQANTAPPGESTLTPTSRPGGTPKLTVEDVTNCRSGPGTGYERITQIGAGEEVEIVGSYPNYWIVETDEGTCWIAMEFSTPSGDMAGIPTVGSAPTLQEGQLKAPILQNWTYNCDTRPGNADVSLRWTILSSNISGFRIYVNDQVFTELPASDREYSFYFALTGGQSAVVRLEAFNESESASDSTDAFSCY